jgi:DNA-binding winged helix-turn-helix (wHTH) protein/tetratricopeptide (TPR) repeat protein
VPETDHDTHYRVGPWTFDPAQSELRSASETVKLEEKISKVLELLCCHDGSLVSKEELIQVGWEGREVSEQTVPVAISKLRKALGDKTDDPTMLETVPRKGYRLVVPPTDALMADTVRKTAITGALPRLLVAVLVLATLFGIWNYLNSDGQSITAPADAAKPGIILTINDVRTLSDGDDQMQRAIALSELASFYLAQVPELLVIRHWWNLDAPDPTGGIFTRYGADTPVYSLKATLIEEEGKAAVTMLLSDPKTDEVLWSGLHFVELGAPGYFAVLDQMLKTLRVSHKPAVEDTLFAEASFADERYWMGRYFMELSNEGAAKTADTAWRALALDYPDDALLAAARASLQARWGLGEGAVLPAASPAYLSVVDRAAVLLYRDKDAAGAAELLKQSLRQAPGDHYALSLLAEANFQMGEEAKGVELLKKAARLAPYARSYSEKLARLEAEGE